MRRRLRKRQLSHGHRQGVYTIDTTRHLHVRPQYLLPAEYRPRAIIHRYSRHTPHTITWLQSQIPDKRTTNIDNDSSLPNERCYLPHPWPPSSHPRIMGEHGGPIQKNRLMKSLRTLKRESNAFNGIHASRGAGRSCLSQVRACKGRQ